MNENFSFEVKKPRREVFESLTDFDRLAVLAGGAVLISPVPDRPRAGKGSAFVLKPAKNGPGPSEVLCETTEWEPPARCTRRFAIPDLPVTAAMRFEDIPGGTRITVDLLLEPQSLMYKMMLPALALKLKSDKEKLLAQFQLELGRPSHSPGEGRHGGATAPPGRPSHSPGEGRHGGAADGPSTT